MDPGIGCENKYFINISEECYHHWKIVKEEMGFKEDEDLLYYLMHLKRRTLSVALEYVVVSNLSKDLCLFRYLNYGKSVFMHNATPLQVATKRETKWRYP